MKTKKLAQLFLGATCTLFLTSVLASQKYTLDPKSEEHFLYTPEADGRFPAIIMLHASGGVEGVHHKLAEIFQEKGYVVYIVDSFNPRGYKDRKSIGWEKATQAQLEDVKPAYDYVASLPKVDNERIGLLGFSMGGYTVLEAMEKNQKPLFASAAAFYPVCKRLPEKIALEGPVKIFIGDDDDRSTFLDCKLLVEEQKHDSQVSMMVYPKALHGFDNPKFAKTTEVMDEKGEKYHIGYDKKTQEKSLQDLIQYFEKELK